MFVVRGGVESILKAPAPLPPHLLPFHRVGSVGMFFIRRGAIYSTVCLHNQERGKERERDRVRKLRKAFIYRYLKAVGALKLWDVL